MTRTAYTPGPWKPYEKYVFKGEDCIGNFDTDNATDRRMKANARLASASPEMLDEIKRQREWLRHIRPQLELPQSIGLGFDQADKALGEIIAKAEGRS